MASSRPAHNLDPNYRETTLTRIGSEYALCDFVDPQTRDVKSINSPKI